MSQEKIVVTEGAKAGQVVPLNGSISIGRSPENHLQLDDPQVSRQHAVIQQTPAGTVIRDLNSGNGTFIGDRRIEEYRLNSGDVISIGSSMMRFEGIEEAAPMGESIFGDTTMGGGGVRLQEGGAPAVESASAEAVYQTLFAGSADDNIRNLQERLRAIYEANQIIASENDLKKLFARVLDQVFQLVPAHNGVIFLKNQKTNELDLAHVKSGSGEDDVAVSTTIVNQSMQTGEALITSDAAGDDRFNTPAGGSIIMQNITSAMCAPLCFQEEVLGVIYVDTRGTTNAFAKGDLELLVAIAGPSAIAIKNAQYLEKLEQAYHDTLIALSNAIELRDHYTVGHTWRVTNFALETARSLGWDEEKLQEVEMGGVLHDIGKIAVDDSILRKPSRLTDEEFAKMKIHPERGARMMQDIEFLLPLIPYCLYHHERYDGRGYPHGMEAENIPVEGRLLAVADTFDAMTSHRPYRRGLAPEIALEELEKGKGTQFDPVMVDGFMKAYKDGRIERILQDYHKSARSIACPFCSTYVPLNDQTEAGDEVSCTVCHRRLAVCEENGAYYGEQITGTQTPRRVSTVTAAPPKE